MSLKSLGTSVGAASRRFGQKIFSTSSRCVAKGVLSTHLCAETLVDGFSTGPLVGQAQGDRNVVAATAGRPSGPPDAGPRADQGPVGPRSALYGAIENETDVHRRGSVARRRALYLRVARI